MWARSGFPKGGLAVWGYRVPLESQQSAGKSTQQTATAEQPRGVPRALSGLGLTCRPGAAGAPGRRQQGPAKQVHARLNKIRQALPACAAGVSVLLTSHAGAAYGIRVWTRIFLPSASRIWTSHCVSVGPGSTPLVGMVQWDQCMHGERVKPARDSQALWDHHLRGGKASRPVLGKFAEPQVCVGGAQMG